MKNNNHEKKNSTSLTSGDACLPRLRVVGEGESEERERGVKKRRDVLTHMLSCACNNTTINSSLQL